MLYMPETSMLSDIMMLLFPERVPVATSHVGQHSLDREDLQGVVFRVVFQDPLRNAIALDY